MHIVTLDGLAFNTVAVPQRQTRIDGITWQRNEDQSAARARGLWCPTWQPRCA